MKMMQEHVYTLDLTEINGKGDFLCPQCGTKISPDDTAEEIYSIIEAKVNSYGLEELGIYRNICGSEIHRTGFLRHPKTIQRVLGTSNRKVMYLNETESILAKFITSFLKPALRGTRSGDRSR